MQGGNAVPSTLALARSTHVRTSSETSGPTLLEELTDASVEEIKDEDDSGRKRTLLGVPIPTFPTTIRGWSETLRRGRERIPMYLPRRLWLRTLKSTILVAKVGTDYLVYISGCHCSPACRYSLFLACARPVNPDLSLRVLLLLLRSWTHGSTTSRRRSRLAPHISRCYLCFVCASSTIRRALFLPPLSAPCEHKRPPVDMAV